MNICMVCINLMPSVSTVLTNICVYLANKQKNPLDIIVSGMNSDLIDSNNSRQVIKLIPTSIIKFQSYQIPISWPWIISKWLNKKFIQIMQSMLHVILRRNLKRNSLSNKTITKIFNPSNNWQSH